MMFNFSVRSLWSGCDLIFYINSTVRLFEFLNEATYDPSKYSVWLCFCLQISRLTIFLYAWQILKGFESLK